MSMERRLATPNAWRYPWLVRGQKRRVRRSTACFIDLAEISMKASAQLDDVYILDRELQIWSIHCAYLLFNRCPHWICQIPGSSEPFHWRSGAHNCRDGPNSAVLCLQIARMVNSCNGIPRWRSSSIRTLPCSYVFKSSNSHYDPLEKCSSIHCKNAKNCRWSTAGSSWRVWLVNLCEKSGIWKRSLRVCISILSST